jgi:hypothetical protein
MLFRDILKLTNNFEEKCNAQNLVFSDDEIAYQNPKIAGQEFTRYGLTNWYKEAYPELKWLICHDTCASCSGPAETDCLTCDGTLNADGTCSPQALTGNLLKFKLNKKYPLDTAPNDIVTLVLTFGTENNLVIDPSITLLSRILQATGQELVDVKLIDQAS